jgi:radical SAM superfamily enzyme YgiQ (UPF0313 family)
MPSFIGRDWSKTRNAGGCAGSTGRDAGPAQVGGVRPRRDLFIGKKYLNITLMQFSRGCRFACSFCAISSYFDRKHHVRKTDEVLREIEMQGRRVIFFVDDNFLSNHAAAKAFLRELIPMRVRWVSQAFHRHDR